ncbi:YbjQ family protein [Paracoccus aminovorans]|uniref:YbjQ family protein n=1 Tax=Paracoccus aminovorans TaxID=34004 RepID=UPI00094222B2|nr:YbjQ family protein [Paracoccus aminovorans]
MAVCAACRNEDFAIDPVSQLCRSCQDELGEGDYATEEEVPEAVRSVLLTTESSSNLKVIKRLGIVSSECVVGQNIFKDVAAGFRDLFGGRSKVMQNGLREARKVVLQELSQEAVELGADAIVAVQLHYASIGGSGSVNMLLLTATGTAVKL